MGNVGLGHVRYATRATRAREERGAAVLRQRPYGIILVHNGNLTNTRELTAEMYNIDRRHLNPTRHRAPAQRPRERVAVEHLGRSLDADQVFDAVTRLHAARRGIVRRHCPHRELRSCWHSGIRTVSPACPRSPALIVPGETNGSSRSESLVLRIGRVRIVRDGCSLAKRSSSPRGQHGVAQVHGELASSCRARSNTSYLARPDSVLSGIPSYRRAPSDG